MTDEEHSDDWPGVDEATEVIRAYERDSKLKPLDAQTHFDYGVAFMELGAGLESHAIEAFKAAARLRPSWSAAHSQLGLAYASANRRKKRSNLTGRPSDSSPKIRTHWRRLLTHLCYWVASTSRSRPRSEWSKPRHLIPVRTSS